MRAQRSHIDSMLVWNMHPQRPRRIKQLYSLGVEWEFLHQSNGISIQDLGEAWGLLNHNWTAVRSPITVANSLQKMMNATLG